MNTDYIGGIWSEIGYDVFDSTSDFEDWLETPNFFFDGDKPINSDYEFITERLTAMLYGDNI